MGTIKQNQKQTSRIAFKSDTSENWAKAKNFSPIKGEPIHYSDLNAIKIGDGETNVNELPFSSDSGAPDNVAIGKAFRFTAAMPQENGTFAFFILDDPDDQIKQLEIGDIVSVIFNNHYDLCAEITYNDLSWIGINKILYDNNGNVETVPDPFPESAAEWNYTIRVPAKPEVGYINIAKYAHVEGMDVVANSIAAHAEGRGSKAYGAYSHAEGRSTLAVWGSHAEGQYTEALNLSSHAEGRYAKAMGDSAHAEGIYTQAVGNGAHAEGSNTEAIREHSHAEGHHTKTEGWAAHAEGNWTYARNTGAHAEGEYTKATASGAHAEGTNQDNTAEAGYLEPHIFTLTRVDNKDKKITVNGPYADGRGSHAEGVQSLAFGYASHAEGATTMAEGICAHAEGELTKALGEQSHAEGMTTTASGTSSHAEGGYTEAKGNYSHTEGYHTLTDTADLYAHAEGYYTHAYGPAAHTEGEYTWADSNGAHAEGSYLTDAEKKLETRQAPYPKASGSMVTIQGSCAYNKGSHAEGLRTFAGNDGAHAEGKDTTATGEGGHAEGIETYAKTHGSHAEGYQTVAGASSGELNLNYAKNYAHAEGQFTYAAGEASHAEGEYTQADSNGAHAEGTNLPAVGADRLAPKKYPNGKLDGSGKPLEFNGPFANARGSHAEGAQTWAGGYVSHAEGFQTEAIADYTHAEGYRVIARGLRSHAEGDVATEATDITKKIKYYDLPLNDGSFVSTVFDMTQNATDSNASFSHREGCNTMTHGTGSHAEGVGNVAYGNSSHVQGYFNITAGNNSHASGKYCRANGNSSSAVGIGLIADGEAQTVVGKHNAVDSVALFIVGAGVGPQGDVARFGTDRGDGPFEPDRDQAVQTTTAINAFTVGREADLKDDFNNQIIYGESYIMVGSVRLKESQLMKIVNLIDTIETIGG